MTAIFGKLENVAENTVETLDPDLRPRMKRKTKGCEPTTPRLLKFRSGYPAFHFSIGEYVKSNLNYSERDLIFLGSKGANPAHFTHIRSADQSNQFRR
jgi:hypothetical protein